MSFKDLLSKKEGKKDWFGRLFPLLLGLGVIFLIFSNTHISKQSAGKSAENSQTSPKTATYEEDLTKRLEEAFSHMEGVGRVQVVLTLADNGQAHVLQDSDYTRSETEETASSGQDRHMLEEQGQTETVRDAADQPFVVKEEAPKVQGVLILAEGAGSSVVQQELLQAAQALLGVSAQNVHIAPYQ